MPRSASKKAQYQARADEAMKAQLAHRKELVGAIGAAEEKRDNHVAVLAEAQRKLDELNNDVVTAYANAIDGGWTEAELKQLDITRPDAKPSKQAKKPASKPPDPHTDGAAESHHHDGNQPHGHTPNGDPAEHLAEPTPALSNGGTFS